MDAQLYNAAISGNIKFLLSNREKLTVETTASNNTVLHLVSQFGHAKCVEAILKIEPSVPAKLNSRKETALHLAVQYGHKEVCEMLIQSAKQVVREPEQIESDVDPVKEMIWMQNSDKDTALHLASRYNFYKIVRLLANEDPYQPHPANSADESPLYLAALMGHQLVVDEILKCYNSPAYNGPQGTTALHAAVISSLSGSVRTLLKHDPDMAKKTNVMGETPLHYAAILGRSGAAKEIMGVDKSCAYIQDLVGKNTAIHVAASQGYQSVISMIVSSCPDIWDVVNGEQQRNILHIAIEKDRVPTVHYILKYCPIIRSIINQKDVDGNTPLHMIATHLCFVPELIYHDLIDTRAVNNNNFAAIDLVAFADHPSELVPRKIMILRELKRAGATGRLLQFGSNSGSDYRIEEIDMQNKVGKTHLIVATLVAAATFAAGFTLPVPGGYNGIKGEEKVKGLKMDLQLFFFSLLFLADSMALALSVSAILILMAKANVARVRVRGDRYSIAPVLIQSSILSMLFAFIAGTYFSMGNSTLALIVYFSVLIICSIFIYPWTQPSAVYWHSLRRFKSQPVTQYKTNFVGILLYAFGFRR